MPSQYYEEKLYPLQDGVLSVLEQSGTDFFLTGGTALSRCYYNHRYSDDLDLFTTSFNEYNAQVEAALDKLARAGYRWSTEVQFVRTDWFTTCMVCKQDNPDLKVKLDFVNDTVQQFGELNRTQLFHRVDSVHNILSNKVSAIYRFAGKDIADIREIDLRTTIDWHQAIYEAKQKDAGIEPYDVARIIMTTPKEEFEGVNWVGEPNWSVFFMDICKIAIDIVKGLPSDA